MGHFGAEEWRDQSCSVVWTGWSRRKWKTGLAVLVRAVQRMAGLAEPL